MCTAETREKERKSKNKSTGNDYAIAASLAVKVVVYRTDPFLETLWYYAYATLVHTIFVPKSKETSSQQFCTKLNTLNKKPSDNFSKTDLVQIGDIQKVWASLVWGYVTNKRVQKDQEETVDGEVLEDPLAGKVHPADKRINTAKVKRVRYVDVGNASCVFTNRSNRHQATSTKLSGRKRKWPIIFQAKIMFYFSALANQFLF